MLRALAADPTDEDDTFRVQVTKELEFRNGDLRGAYFECLVEHQDIERVCDNGGRINISCVVTVLEDNRIELPPPSVRRSICATIASQAPVDVVFDIVGYSFNVLFKCV